MGSNVFLKVTASMSTPVAGGTPSLDGVLLFHACKRHYGGLDTHAPNQILEYDPELVPIEIIEPGGDWFYACSAAILPSVVAHGAAYLNRRFDDKYAALTEKRSVNLAAGEFKLRRERIAYTHALEIVWFVRGNEARITDILGDCLHLGRMRSQGYGRVASWAIERVEEDYSLLFGDKPTRPIPHAYYTTHVKRELPPYVVEAYMGYRPPYSYPQNQGHVVLAVSL